ncbi:tol-pal system protein YbgF [Gammaproteobacteria bacterium]|nr:tol-pal system protein YbgF [Gammaproteobacteria bacterium]
MPVDKHSLRQCTGFVAFLFCVAMWLPASYGLAAGDGPDGDEPVKEQLQPATIILPAPSVVRIDPDVSKALLALQELREELKGLRNALDLLAFDLKKLDQRQRDLYDDLDERLRRQERASVVTSVNPSTETTLPVITAVPVVSDVVPSSSKPAQSRVPVPVVTVQESSPEIAVTSSNTESLPTAVVVGSVTTMPISVPEEKTPTTTSGASDVSDTVAGSVPKIAVTVTPGIVTAVEKAAYDKAFSLLKQSRYADAALEFETFLREHPSGGLNDDAWYWMAQARYVMREFETALNAYQTIANYFPESSRVPASLLKIGYIQYEMAAYPEARQTLSDLLERFPAHRVAVSAETRLKKMDREGR